MFRRFFALVLSALIACSLPALSGCTQQRSGDRTIIATLFPQYSFARQIAGERFDVRLLLSPGTESHSYDPTPGDMLELSRAAVFAYTGEEMEPWAHELIESADMKGVQVVDCSEGIKLIESEQHEEEQQHGEEHEHEHSADPHLWLDLGCAQVMVDNLLSGIIKADPENAEEYTANASLLKTELSELDGEFEALFDSADTRTIVFGGRFSYIYFINRYRLDYVTAYSSCSSNAEPSVAEIAAVVDYIRSSGARAIYHEELTDPTVARSIADETGVSLLEFSTAHNVTAEQLKAGVTFQDIMRQNLKNLRGGLSK